VPKGWVVVVTASSKSVGEQTFIVRTFIL
jgi:hypothetical protein